MGAEEATRTWQMASSCKVLVVIYVSAARSDTLGKYSRKTYRFGGRGAIHSLLIEMFSGGGDLSSYPELLLQAQPVVGSPGVVKPVQMALQRAHIQLGVSVQKVLQQSLVDEGVLHLRERRRRRGGRSLVSSNSLFCSPRLVCAATAASGGFGCQSEEPGGSGGVNAYICLDELTALLSYSAHGAKDIHPLLHVHHVDHAVNDDKRPGPPHPGAAERKQQTAGNKHGAFCLS